MRHRARHHIDGHGRTVPTSRRECFLKVNLQKRCARHRSNRIHPLGMVKTKPAPLPSRHEQHTNFPRSNRRRSAFSSIGRRPTIAALPISEPHRRRWRSSTRHRCPILRRRTLAKQLRDLFEIDRSYLRRQIPAGRLIQLIPKLKQMLLPERSKSRGQFLAIKRRSHQNIQPLTQAYASRHSSGNSTNTVAYVKIDVQTCRGQRAIGAL